MAVTSLINLISKIERVPSPLSVINNKSKQTEDLRSEKQTHTNTFSQPNKLSKGKLQT